MKFIPSCFSIISLLLPIISQANDNQSYSEVQSKSFFKDTTIWPKMNVSVCWEKQEAPEFNNTFDNRLLTRRAIEQSWEKASLIRFTGWDWCPNGYFKGVRISMGDESVSHGLGKEVLNIHPATNKRGLTLDFNLNIPTRPTNDPFNNVSMKQRCSDNGKNLEQCIQFTAIHEFGHVLGLSHEHNRDFRLDSCSLDDSAGYNVHGNTDFTDYDPDSIMNYCRQNYYGDTNLSIMDKISVKAYYGRIPTFVGETSKLDIPRVMFEGNPYKVTLQYGSDGKFTFITSSPTNDSPENQSSVETTFTNSILTLPVIRYMDNGKVKKLWKATLRQGSDGKLYIINFNVHPDTKV
jgi:hypothetical protein